MSGTRLDFFDRYANRFIENECFCARRLMYRAQLQARSKVLSSFPG